jgi:hypothetical protein
MQSKISIKLRNPFYLDSESGFDWTVNPEGTGQFFSSFHSCHLGD